jgi:hypothetical protein
MDFGLSVKERQEITKAVNEYPGKALLFLGAGASKPWGLPVMNGFFEAVYKGYEGIYGRDVRTHVNTYLEAFREGSDNDADLRLLLLIRNIYQNPNEVWDLERVVTALDEITSLKERGITRSPESLLYGLYCDYYEYEKAGAGKFIAFSEETYGKVFNLLMPKIIEVYNIDKGTKIIDMIYNDYRAVIDILRGYSKEPVPIFTTNYDLVLEKYVFSDNYFDGFRFTHGRTRPKFDIRYLIDYLTSDNYGRTLLIKLHGSLNWMGSGNETLRLHDEIPHNEFANADYKLPVIGKGITEKDKAIFKCNYALFSDFIKRPDLRLVLVIGSSLRDTPILDIFNEGFTYNEKLYMIITSKNLTDLSAGEVDVETLLSSDKVSSDVIDFYKEFEDRIIPIPFRFHDDQDDLLRAIEGYVDQREIFKGSSN